MKKKFILLSISLAGVLSACVPENTDKQASAEYVGAAQNAMKAKALFENADFEKSRATFNQARAQVSRVIEKYPSSPIALRLVSESDVRLASFELDEVDEIIEKLEIITNPSLKKIARTIAIAESFESDSEDSFNAYKTLLDLVDTSDAFSDTEKLAIITNNPKLAVMNKRFTQKVKQSTTAKKTQKLQAKKNLSDAEIKKLLAEAQKNASYCAFELSASEALLKKAKLVEKSFSTEFSKILRQGYAKAKIITIEKLRAKACANLAAAAAKSGNDELALEIISQIKNPEAFENVFSELASSLGKTKNYPAALAIAANVKNKKTKNAFLAELAQNIALQNKIATAIEIAKQISTIKEKNSAIAKLAVFAYDKQDTKNFILALSNLDISDLEFSAEFSKYAKKDYKTSSCENLAILAKITIPLNQKIAKILTNLAIKEYSQKSDAQNLEIEKLIAENLFNLYAEQDALEFISKSKSPINRAKVILKMLKDKTLALKMLKEIKLEFSGWNRIYFAFLVETSSLSGQEKNDLLKSFLKLK